MSGAARQEEEGEVFARQQDCRSIYFLYKKNLSIFIYGGEEKGKRCAVNIFIIKIINKVIRVNVGD